VANILAASSTVSTDNSRAASAQTRSRYVVVFKEAAGDVAART